MSKTFETRRAIENQCVRHLLRTAQAAGYSVVYDDAETRIACTSETQAMQAVFAVDESIIRFSHPERPGLHCAVIILGNDGWDCICDHSLGEGWDEVMAASATFSQALAEPDARPAASAALHQRCKKSAI